jgi:hypothetical protein
MNNEEELIKAINYRNQYFEKSCLNCEHYQERLYSDDRCFLFPSMYMSCNGVCDNWTNREEVDII